MREFSVGIAAVTLGSAPVIFGLMFASAFLPRQVIIPHSASPALLAPCYRHNALNYANIVENGYSYDIGKRSEVAFFPGYPIAAQTLVVATGWPSALALLAIANLTLLGAFAVLSVYLRSRFPRETQRHRYLMLTIFALAPPSFFFGCPTPKARFCS